MSQDNVVVVRRAWESVSSHGDLPLELWDEDLRIENMWASVLTLREGRIVHAQGYWTPEQAREAVGLRG